MAQTQVHQTIAAPAFKGVNTEDSPVGLDPSYAIAANNCVIDQYGRIGCRKGFKPFSSSTTSPSYSDPYYTNLFSFIRIDGTHKIFGTRDDGGIYDLTTSTPSKISGAFNQEDTRYINFNSECLAVGSDGSFLLLYVQGGTGDNTFDRVTTAPKCYEGIGAFGRLWLVTTEVGDNKQVIKWGDLLSVGNFSTGSAGSINVSKVWPKGQDNIVGLAAHNGRLIIFGSNNILIYAGAEDPATMVLEDAISGVGCLDRNTIQNTGTDVVFLSSQGLLGLARTIQEKSLPVRDLSRNVQSELKYFSTTAAGPISSVYSPEEGFYLLFIPDSIISGTQYNVYCFNMEGQLEQGQQRVTKWPNTYASAMSRGFDGTLYMACQLGAGTYEGFIDLNDKRYTMEVVTAPITFGDTSRLKIPKRIAFQLKTGYLLPTGEGGDRNAFIKWYYDYDISPTEEEITLNDFVDGTQQGTLSFNSIYLSASGAVDNSIPYVNPTGNGRVFSVGFETRIENTPISIQEINIKALLGKLV